MFPSVLNTFTYPNPTDRLNSPSHSSLHNATSSILGQVQAVIGVEGTNSVVGSLQYLIKSPASDGGGHVQTANKGGTGQTSYNKGDLLVASSSSVLTKLVVGTEGQILKVNSSLATGIGWATAGFARVYSSNDVWIKPSTLSSATIICIGGGGGGGNGISTTSAGGGGGGGGISFKIVAAGHLPTAVSVLVAASVAAETNGEHSRFGSILVAYGGLRAFQTAGGAGGHNGVGSVTGNAISGQGASPGNNAEYGGGGGGGGGSGAAGLGQIGQSGGSAIFGGGGGGAGSSASVSGAGGTTQSYSVAGGGTSSISGNGGNGGYLQGGGGGSGHTGNGGNGGVGGGGGGGGYSASAGTTSGGMGGRGEVIIIES